MHVELIDDLEQLTSDQIQLIIDLINLAGEKIKANQKAELAITFVDNQMIQELNRSYRQIDRPTDVLSFALTEGEEPIDWSLAPADQSQADFGVHLGDIIISIERAREQAQEYEHSLDRELGFLAVHGFLHLNGYDHQTPSQEQEMFKLQEEVLSDYGLLR